MGIRKTEYAIEIFGLETKKEFYKTLDKTKSRVKALLDRGNVSFDIWVIRYISSKGIKGKQFKGAWEVFKNHNQLRAFDHTTNTVFKYNKQRKSNLWYVKQFDFMLSY